MTIKNNSIEIEDHDGDLLRFYWEPDSKWFIVESDNGGVLLVITVEDAAELVKFLLANRVSA